MNNWYVVTGGPNSGKTTTLNELKKRGFTIVPEAARTFIDREMRKGKTLKEIREDEFRFQQKLLKFKVKREKSLPKNQVFFFDRGMHDSGAYVIHLGKYKNKDIQVALKNATYKKVFILELLPGYKKDYARTENAALRKKLHRFIEEVYREFKLTILNVPVMTVQKRVNFILKNL